MSAKQHFYYQLFEQHRHTVARFGGEVLEADFVARDALLDQFGTYCTGTGQRDLLGTQHVVFTVAVTDDFDGLGLFEGFNVLADVGNARFVQLGFCLAEFGDCAFVKGCWGGIRLGGGSCSLRRGGCGGCGVGLGLGFGLGRSVGGAGGQQGQSSDCDEGGISDTHGLS